MLKVVAGTCYCQRDGDYVAMSPVASQKRNGTEHVPAFPSIEPVSSTHTLLSLSFILNVQRPLTCDVCLKSGWNGNWL